MGLLSHHPAKVMGQESHHCRERSMRVFVTGGTGLIGSTVVALARSDASALAAEAAGAEPLRGALADLDVLRAGVAQADGVIHLAFANDFSSPGALAKAVAEESAALATLGEELAGSDRPFVTVSGTPRAGSGARRYACRARFTTRAPADSPAC